nr:MAG TPA: hypothetical protein [Bacteriophage sp.]
MEAHLIRALNLLMAHQNLLASSEILLRRYQAHTDRL